MCWSITVRANLQITFAQQEIEAFCRKWKITEFSLFGSVLRDDFRPDSDVDVLVTFSPEAHWRYYNLLDMKDELKAIFGREVDVVEKRLVEKSENYIQRKHILSNLETVYAA
jgi:predicted nucleotidyltransferase